MKNIITSFAILLSLSIHGLATADAGSETQSIITQKQWDVAYANCSKYANFADPSSPAEQGRQFMPPNKLQHAEWQACISLAGYKAFGQDKKGKGAKYIVLENGTKHPIDSKYQYVEYVATSKVHHLTDTDGLLHLFINAVTGASLSTQLEQPFAYSRDGSYVATVIEDGSDEGATKRYSVYQIPTATAEKGTARPVATLSINDDQYNPNLNASSQGRWLADGSLELPIFCKKKNGSITLHPQKNGKWTQSKKCS